MNENKNRMVLLAEQLRELTHGVCVMGPGPYGIGVSTHEVSPLTAVLQLTPDPFPEENLHFPGDLTCKAEIKVFIEAQRRRQEYLTQEELIGFSQGDHAAARMVAEAALRINASDPVLTVQECNDAFNVLADWHISGQEDRSPAELEFISSLSEEPAPKTGMEMTM